MSTTRCSLVLLFLLLSVLLGSGYKCPGANSLEGRPANCARIWMGKGHPNKDQVLKLHALSFPFIMWSILLPYGNKVHFNPTSRFKKPFLENTKKMQLFFFLWQACNGPSFTFKSGYEYPCCRLSVGSVLVRHGCKVNAWHLGHHNGEYLQYTPGLYSLNMYFYLGDAGGSPNISPYGWGSFYCQCNLTMGKWRCPHQSRLQCESFDLSIIKRAMQNFVDEGTKICFWQSINILSELLLACLFLNIGTGYNW